MNNIHYASIRNLDISNGEGIGVALFVQGCHFHCYNCFNTETWDFNGGKEWTPEVKEKFLELIDKSYIKRVSILGGEPMHPKNIEGTTKLAKEFKEKFPNKTVWAWTGFNFENNLKDKEVMKYIDVLVDGQYVDEKRNPTIQWRGSENQRVIDVQKSLANHSVVKYE